MLVELGRARSEPHTHEQHERMGTTHRSMSVIIRGRVQLADGDRWFPPSEKVRDVFSSVTSSMAID